MEISKKNAERSQIMLYAIGGKLRAVRKSEKIKIEEVERYTGIPQSTLTAIERGEVKANVIHLIKLCGLYNIEPNSIFEGLIR